MADTIITVGGDLTPLERQIQDVLSKNFKLSGIDSRRFTQPLGKIKGQLGEFEKSLEASNARVVAFGASAGAIYLLGDAFKGLVRSTIEVEKSLADINTVLGESSSNIKKFGNEIFNVANETSQSFETAAQAALEFSRQGLGLEETLKRTSAALTLAKISGLSAADSVEALTATINSFNDAALTDIQIVNKLAAVDARYAVSSADLAEAIKRVGSSASEAGVSLDQLIALVTSAQQTTARGGAVIGNSFKTIFTRIQRPKVLESLEEIGITTKTVTGQTLPLIQILNQLASTYDSLGAAQKSQIAELVGGVYQINILKAVVGDLSKEFGSTYAGALRASSTATNEAEKRIGSLAQTLDSQINRITNNLKRAGSVIGDLTIAPALEKVLGAANNILETFALGKEPESYGEKAAVGFLKGLGNFISGPGLILGAAAAFQIFKRLAAFVNDAGKTILGLGQASQRQAEIQAQILQLLQRNPALYSQIQSGAISVQDAAQGYLNIVNLTNAALERQKALAGQIAQVAFSGGAGPITGATRGPRRRASSGFIPNFAAEGQILESVGAANHKNGYKAGQAYQTTIHDGEGNSFRSWVNSAEKVKTFTNAAGYKATIVRPPNGFGPGTQMAAEGFVPNFAPKKAKDKGLRIFRSDAKVSSISGSSLNASFDRKQSSYRINIRPTSTAFFESSDKRKQMDTGRKSLDAGYTVENGQIVPNSAFDKFMGAINVYKVADAEEINTAANATWEGLIKKDPSWITNPVFSQFGLSSKNARRAFFNSLRKSKLSYADIKEKFNRQNGNATNDAVYKFGSGKTMTSPEDYKKSLNGDFNNFKGAFYEAFIANKLGSKYSLSKGDYDPVDIVAKEGAGTKFKGFEVKSGSVANVSTLVNKALNSINFNSANDAPAVVDFGTFPVIQTRGSSIGGVSNFSSGFIPNFAPGDGSYTLAEYANKKGVLISQLKGAALNAAYAKGVSLEEIKRYNPKFEYKGATAQEAARRQASVKALEQQHAYRGKPVLEKVLPWNKTVDDFGGDNNKFGSAYEQEVFAMLKKKYQNRFKTATELGLVGIRAKDGQILENNYSDVEGAVLDKKGRVMFWVEVKAQSKKRHLSFRRTGKDRVSDKFERAERKNINLPTNPRVRGIVFRNLAKGFIPNFANGYIDKVMNLESNISGNRAILDTTTGPFPFIRNSSQPNFAAAISDHGGLNNALNDSLRNQKNAGLMSGGYVPNFAAKAMLPGPEAIQEILANQKKKLITNLDFDNTLVKTKGDEEYAKAKSQEAKQAVLNKYFRNPIARMRDVKRSPLTTFGNDLLRGIRRGSIDPKYLGIMTASDNTPGLADFLLRRFRIPKKNMKFGIRGAVGKPPIEAKLGLAGKYENRKTGSGSVVDDLAYPNQSRGFIPNFANSQEDIFSKIKIKNKEDGIESYFPKSSKFKNQKVAGSVRAFPIAPNLYSVTSAGVNMKGFGFGVALYDTLLAEVSKKGAWLTSDRETVSDDAKQIWDGYRKQRTVDVQSKKLPMKYWNLHPAFNGGSYEFSMNPEEDFLRNKSTWPPIGDAVWSLQHAYKFKKHALDTFKNITVQAGIAHERRAIEKKEAEDAQLAKVNAAKQLIVSGNVLERNSEKTGINYLMGSLNISRKEATKRVKKYKKDQAKRYAEYEKLIPLDEDQRVVIDLATEKTYSKPFIYHHYDIATTEPDLKKYNIQSSQDLEERDNLVRAYLIAKKWEKPSLKYLLTEVNKNFVTKHKKQNFLLGLKKNWASRFAPGVTRRMSDYKMLVQGLPHLTSEGEHVVANDSKALPRMSSSSGFIPNFNNSNLNSSLRRAALGVRGLTPFVIDLKRKTSEVGGNNTLWHKDIVNKQFVTGEGKDKKRIYGGRYDLNDQDIHSSEYANTFVRGFVNKDTGQVLIDLTAAQKLDPEFRSKHREFVNNELDKISKRYTPKSSKGNIPQIPKRILTEYAKFTRYNPLAFNSPPESANKGFIPNFAISLSSMKKILKEAKGKGLQINRVMSKDHYAAYLGLGIQQDEFVEEGLREALGVSVGPIAPTIQIPKNVSSSVLLHEIGHFFERTSKMGPEEPAILGSESQIIASEVAANREALSRLTSQKEKQFYINQTLPAFKTYKKGAFSRMIFDMRKRKFGMFDSFSDYYKKILKKQFPMLPESASSQEHLSQANAYQDAKLKAGIRGWSESDTGEVISASGDTLYIPSGQGLNIKEIIDEIKKRKEDLGLNQRYFSDGFIANFALNDAINREMDAGYSRSQIRIGKSPSLATGFNPEGYGVYNSSEGSLQKGMSLAQKAGIDPKTKGMSAGHVPNFATVDAGKVFGATGGFEALTGEEQLKFTELNKALSKLARDFTLTMGDQGGLRTRIGILAKSLAKTTGSTDIISEASNALGKSLQQNRQAQQKQANATAQAQKSAQAMQHAKVSQRENLYRKIADVGPDVKRRFVAQRERVIKNVGASERSRLSTGVSDAAMERAQRKLQQKKLFEEAKLARQQANVSQTARTEAGMRLAKYYGKGIQSPAGNAPVTPSAGGGTGGAASGGRKGRKPRGGAVPTVPPAGGGGPVPPAGGGTGGAASGGRAGMMGDQFGGLGKAFLLNQLLSTAGSFAPEEYQEPIGKVAGAIASFSTVQALAQSFKPQEGQRPFGEGKMGDLMNTDVLKFGRKGGGLRKGLSNVASKFPRAAGAIKGVGSLGRGALSLGRSAIGGIGGAIGAFAGPLAAAYTVGSLGQDAIDYFGFTGMGGFGGTGTRDQGKEIKALEEEQKKFKTESGKALAGYLAKSRSTSGAFGEATGEKVQQGFGGILGSMGFGTSENLMKFNFGEERKSAAAAITEELGGSANLKKIYEESGGGQGKGSLDKFTEKVFATLQNAGKETGGLTFDKERFKLLQQQAAAGKALNEEETKLLETYKAAKDAAGQLQKNLQQMEKAKEISKTFQGVASSMASAGAKATAMLQIYKLVQEKEKQRGELLKTNYGGGYEGFINPQKNLDSMSQIENALKTLNDPRLKGNAVERGRAAARYMEGTTALGINMPVAQQAQLSKMIEMGQTTSNERTLNTIGMIGGRYGNNFGIQQGIGMSRAAEAAITKQTGLTTAERQLSAESAMSNVGYRTSQEMKAMTMTDPQVKALEATVKAVEESMNKLAGLADAANTNKISMEQFNQAAAALQAVANNKNAEANIGEQLQAVFNTLPEKLQAIAATNTNKIQSETSVTGNVTLELTGEAQRILKQAETLIALSKGTNSEGTPLPAAGGAMDSRKFNNCHIARLCIPNEWQAFYFWKELIAPDWFRNFYNKYSESIANWMNNKPTVQKLVAKWMKSRINKLIPKNK